MHLHLYRPVTWRRGGRCVCLTDAREVSPREAALLVRLGWATWVGDELMPIYDVSSQFRDPDSCSRPPLAGDRNRLLSDFEGVHSDDHPLKFSEEENLTPR